MTIYFDMDGVLARWNPRASTEDTKKAGYFLTPKAEYSVLYCIKALMRKGYTVRILTAYYTGGSAMAEKQEWLKK